MVARDRTQQADLLRLAEHSIEADLAKHDRTINTIAQALRAVTTSIGSAGWGPASGTAAVSAQAFVEDPLRTLRIARRNTRRGVRCPRRLGGVELGAYHEPHCPPRRRTKW